MVDQGGGGVAGLVLGPPVQEFWGARCDGLRRRRRIRVADWRLVSRSVHCSLLAAVALRWAWWWGCCFSPVLAGHSGRPRVKGVRGLSPADVPEPAPSSRPSGRDSSAAHKAHMAMVLSLPLASCPATRPCSGGGDVRRGMRKQEEDQALRDLCVISVF